MKPRSRRYVVLTAIASVILVCAIVVLTTAGTTPGSVAARVICSRSVADARVVTVRLEAPKERAMSVFPVVRLVPACSDRTLENFEPPASPMILEAGAVVECDLKNMRPVVDEELPSTCRLRFTFWIEKRGLRGFVQRLLKCRRFSEVNLAYLSNTFREATVATVYTEPFTNTWFLTSKHTTDNGQRPANHNE